MAFSRYTLLLAMCFCVCCSLSNVGEKVRIEVHGSEMMNDRIILAGYQKHGPEISHKLRGCIQIAIKDGFVLPKPPVCKNWVAFIPYDQFSQDVNGRAISLVQKAGYSAAIVSVKKPDTGFIDHPDVIIPTIHVHKTHEKSIEEKMPTVHVNENTKYRYGRVCINRAEMKFSYTLIPDLLKIVLPVLLALCTGLLWCTRQRPAALELDELLSLLNKDNKQNFDKLPRRKYKPGDRNDTCYICLEDFMREEELKELPCRHCFHETCIKDWVVKHMKTSCPVCRQDIFEQPGV